MTTEKGCDEVEVRWSIFPVIDVVDDVYILLQVVCNGLLVTGHQSPPVELTRSTADYLPNAMQRLEIVEVSSA